MSIYVHIPFCKSKCWYCDFYSVPPRNLLADYVKCAVAEMRLRMSETGLDSRPPRSLYIGGGTPSQLPAELISQLMDGLPRPVDDAEVTIEVNPDDVTAELAYTWRSLGINRVSMGVQSFCNEELVQIGRRHNAGQAINAFHTLRQAGFDNISLDLIYGLPGQTLTSWSRSLDTLFELSPEHFSAYILSFEPGTRLYARLISGKVEEASEVLIAKMYQMLCTKAVENGYCHYEISNFAKPGRRARHNSSYWDFLPYVGIGPGAHSFDGTTRRFNPPNLKEYIETLKANKLYYTIDPETDTDRINDRIMVSLRTAAGLNLASLPKAARNAVLAAAGNLTTGLVTITDNHIVIPEESWLVSDAIIRDLLL